MPKTLEGNDFYAMMLACGDIFQIGAVNDQQVLRHRHLMFAKSCAMPRAGTSMQHLNSVVNHSTSRSAYTRGKEHLRALEQREESSVLWRHCCDIHAGNIASFTMNVTGTFQNDAMLRQITESTMINQTKEDQLINTKEEWAYFRNPGAVVTQS
ncbi:hypothetical protein ACROYT_G015303 [Oculina patagonica]